MSSSASRPRDRRSDGPGNSVPRLQAPCVRDRTVNDEALMRRLCRGDEVAFTILYDRYAPQVHGVALAILHDDSLAEEVTHDVFLGLWGRPQAFEAEHGLFIAWFLRIAHNRSIDLIRRRHDQPFSSDARDDGQPSNPTRWSADADPDPADEAIARLVGGDVRAALARLTPDQRRLLELAYFGGLTQREIAAHLDRPLGTVKTQIRTAMQRLADLLDAWNPVWTNAVDGGLP